MKWGDAEARPRAYPDSLLRGLQVPRGPQQSPKTQAGHSRWAWLPGPKQVKVKASALCPPPKLPYQVAEEGTMGGTTADLSSKRQRAHPTLHHAHFHYICQGNPEYFGNWLLAARQAVSQRLCFKSDLSPQNSKGFWGGVGEARLLTSKTRSESSCLPIVVLLFRTKKPSALFR